ncbi:MAG: DUF1552 domain-containing protein [Bryobacterales bacterium]|nr:DUF1552 domain-containing protein [Bryobacterales bacterium]
MDYKPNHAGRRYFLRAAGITLALPILESLTDRVLGSGRAVSATGLSAATTEGARPRRLVCIGNHLGFYPPAFFPKAAGKDYELPLLLEPIAAHRKNLTVFSGLDHGVKGGHFAVHAFLSGVRNVDAKGMPEGNITLDQRAAETVGGATRFPCLTIGSEDGIHGGTLMSWTRSGTRVNPIQGPREVFRKLFLDDTPDERANSKDRLSLQGSILDAVNGDAKSLGRDLGKRDREKLEEYFTSVRDVEQQIQLNRQWADVPKPKAPMKEPENRGMVSDLPVLYDLVVLALQTDSTRIATLEIAGGFLSQALGVKKEYHALSHHGQVQEDIDSLLTVEKYQMEQFARFLAKLSGMEDGGGTMLQHTSVLFGSGIGNANSHVNSNLPVIVAGGGFRHGEYKAYPQGNTRVPLCNLYLTLLQRFGVQAQRFGTSTSTLTGFDAA